MLNRIKQVQMLFFQKYDSKNDVRVKNFLSKEEFLIFDKMSNYEKCHSFRLLEMVLKSDILSENVTYHKLALLHDCGKEILTFLDRVMVVLTKKDKHNHTLKGYQKLKDINLELALLCRDHHTLSDDINMTEFQRLDDI